MHNQIPIIMYKMFKTNETRFQYQLVKNLLNLIVYHYAKKKDMPISQVLEF